MRHTHYKQEDPRWDGGSSMFC